MIKYIFSFFDYDTVLSKELILQICLMQISIIDVA